MTGKSACFINSMRVFGGAEVWLLDAAAGLRERGWDISLVAQPDSPLLARARAAGLPADPVAIRCDGAPWTVAKLVAVLRRRRPGALLCNLTKDLKAAGLAGTICRVPVRLACRESDFPLKDKFYYRWYFTRAATGVVANSAATRATVLASAPWLAPSRVHLLYKGIDTARFRPGGPPPGPPVVGFAGQLITRKGLPDLLAAWRDLEASEASGGACLRLAGDGPLRGEVARWREGLRHPERVEALGFVEDMPSFYYGLSLLVLPSRAEGFGLVAAEAGACGLPVIAARASSLPEIVVDGQTGLLVPPGDVGALAGAITRLLQDPALARRLGDNARARVSHRFSRESMLGGLERLLAKEADA